MDAIQHQFNYQEAIVWLARRLKNPSMIKGFSHSEASREQINKDIARTEFLSGSAASMDYFFDGWQKNRDFCFSQGDMDGGFFAQYLWLQVYFNEQFINQKHIKALDVNQFCDLRFGYVNDNNERSGFCLRYLKNNPKHWIICIMKNADKEQLSDRQVTLFYSDFFYNELINDKSVIIDKRNQIEEKVFSAIHSEVISSKLHGFISGGKINNKISLNCRSKLIQGSEYFKNWLVALNEAQTPEELLQAINQLLSVFEQTELTKLSIEKYLESIYSARRIFIENNSDILLSNLGKLYNYLNKYHKTDLYRLLLCETVGDFIELKRAQPEKVTQIMPQPVVEQIKQNINASPKVTIKISSNKQFDFVLGGLTGLALGIMLGVLLSGITAGLSLIIFPIITALLSGFFSINEDSKPAETIVPQAEKKTSQTTALYINQLDISFGQINEIKKEVPEKLSLIKSKATHSDCNSQETSIHLTRCKLR